MKRSGVGATDRAASGRRRCGGDGRRVQFRRQAAADPSTARRSKPLRRPRRSGRSAGRGIRGRPARSRRVAFKSPRLARSARPWRSRRRRRTPTRSVRHIGDAGHLVHINPSDSGKGDRHHLPERPAGGHRREALVVARMVPVPLPGHLVHFHPSEWRPSFTQSKAHGECAASICTTRSASGRFPRPARPMSARSHNAAGSRAVNFLEPLDALLRPARAGFQQVVCFRRAWAKVDHGGLKMAATGLLRLAKIEMFVTRDPERPAGKAPARYSPNFCHRTWALSWSTSWTSLGRDNSDATYRRACARTENKATRTRREPAMT